MDFGSDPFIGKYCGTSLPPNQISSSKKVKIEFKTNSGDTKKGFKLEYNPHGKYVHHFWKMTVCFC